MHDLHYFLLILRSESKKKEFYNLYSRYIPLFFREKDYKHLNKNCSYEFFNK